MSAQPPTSSSSSSLASLAGKEVKKLEKLMAKEAKADQKALDHALKDVRSAEKVLQKSAKVRPRASAASDHPERCSLQALWLQEADKAEALVRKTKEKELTVAKKLSKVKHKHVDALGKQAKAEDGLTVRVACAVHRAPHLEADTSAIVEEGERERHRLARAPAEVGP